MRLKEIYAKLRRFHGNSTGGALHARIWGLLNLAGGAAILFAFMQTPWSSGPLGPLVDQTTYYASMVFLLNGLRLVVAPNTPILRIVASFILRYLQANLGFYLALYIILVLLFVRERILEALAPTIVWGVAFLASRLWKRQIDSLADALQRPLAKNVRRADKRRPVVLFRSFQDDSAMAQNERVEDNIARNARHCGPLIAMGEPGKLPRSGAARTYYRGDDWREAVEAWMDEALCIVMIAGLTEGVRWELETALKRGHARKLILIIPRDANHETRWARAEKNLAESGVAAQMRGVDSKEAIAMHLDANGQLVILRATFATGSTYGAAFAIALYGMFFAQGEAAAEPLEDSA